MPRHATQRNERNATRNTQLNATQRYFPFTILHATLLPACCVSSWRLPASLLLGGRFGRASACEIRPPSMRPLTSVRPARLLPSRSGGAYTHLAFAFASLDPPSKRSLDSPKPPPTGVAPMPLAPVSLTPEVWDGVLLARPGVVKHFFRSRGPPEANFGASWCPPCAPEASETLPEAKKRPPRSHFGLIFDCFWITFSFFSSFRFYIFLAFWDRRSDAFL